MDTDELLNEAIVHGFTNLSDLPPGTSEQTVAVDNIAKLYKLKIEEDKAQLDFREKIDQNDCDDKFKRTQLKSEEFRQYLRLGVEAMGIVLPLITSCFWMGRGFRFEETGTISSQTGRSLFNQLIKIPHKR